MMDNNDILEMLQSYVCHTSSDYDHKQDVIKQAKVLVERDKAKKPKYMRYNSMASLRNSYYCPICEIVFDEQYPFCPECGQRLDWRGE